MAGAVITGALSAVAASSPGATSLGAVPGATADDDASGDGGRQAPDETQPSRSDEQLLTVEVGQDLAVTGTETDGPGAEGRGPGGHHRPGDGGTEDGDGPSGSPSGTHS